MACACNPVACHLCDSEQLRLLHEGCKRCGNRKFWHCANCDLVFVPREFHVSSKREKARYLLHNNDVGDESYRVFLSRMYNELKPMLPAGARGLDYGAGPGPALAAMMRDDGFSVGVYDPYFFPDRSLLMESYDFITCTETVEHFRAPRIEFVRLDSMLKISGWLGVMTSMPDTWQNFDSWYYHFDPTHVCFYNKTTMSWIAQSYGWRALFPAVNVTLFQKLSK